MLLAVRLVLNYVHIVRRGTSKKFIQQNPHFLWTRSLEPFIGQFNGSSELNCVSRAISTTSVLCKKQAGRYKVTQRHNKPLTYEQSQKPHQIGESKTQNSQNTSNLLDGRSLN